MAIANVSVQQKIEDMVAEIAKEKKLSKVVLMSVAQRAIELGGVTHKAGRKISDDSKRLRDFVMGMGSGEKFTCKQIAEKLSTEQTKVNPVYVSNAIKWAQENGKSIVECGKVEHVPGQRGKRAVIWQFN